MAITISGENNNDRILAQDGVIDSISGFNIAGIITASSFTGDLTGDVTGNLIGNVTGNINNTTLLLQTGGSERVRIASNGKVGVGVNPQNYPGIFVVSGDALICDRDIHSRVANTVANSDRGFKQDIDGVEKLHLYADNSSNIILEGNGGNEKLRISSAGKVGIGTDFIDANLTIHTVTPGQNVFNIHADLGTNNNRTFNLYAPATDSGNDPYIFQTGNSMQFKVDNYDGIKLHTNGRVGVGTVNPATALDIYATPIESATINTTNSTQLGLWVRAKNPSNTTGNIYTGITLGEGRAGLYAYDDGGGAAHGMGFWTGSNSGVAERLRIDSNGRVLIGHTLTPTASVSVAVVGSYGGSSTNTPFVYLCRDEDATSVSVNESLGQILFASRDGYRGALVEAKAAGTWSGSSSDGYLVFKTTPDNATVPEERLRITSDGKIGIDIQNPVARLHVHNSGTSAADHAYAHFTTGDTGSNITDGLTVGIAANQVASVNFREAGTLTLNTSSSPRITILSNGKVGINDSSPGNQLSVKHDGLADNNYAFAAEYRSGNNASGYTASGISIVSSADNSNGEKHTAYIKFSNRDPALNTSHGAGAFITMSTPDSPGTYGTGEFNFYCRNGSAYTFPNDPAVGSSYWMSSLFKIKSTGELFGYGNLRIDTGTAADGIVGRAYGTAYFGLKHADQSSDEYMIISNDYHTYISCTSGHSIYIRPSANSSAHETIFSHDNTEFNSNIVLDNHQLRRNQHHKGHMEGGYNNIGASSGKTSPIYTIGSSYNPDEDTLSNMYGIGYSHTNASFINSNAIGAWGMYVASDGDARIFLGASDGRIFADQSYGRTSWHTGHLEGGHTNIGASQTKTNPIFTIGSAYNPNETTLNNMYGVGYSYGSNASFLPAGGWGMYVASDGDARIFLDAQNANIKLTTGQGALYFSNGTWSGESSTGKIQTHNGHMYIQNAGNSSAWAFRLPNATEPFKINANGTTGSSDERLKKDITTITGAVDTVKQLIGRSFTWKLSDKKSYGVIAQEVEPVLPELIETQTVLEGEENNEPYKMMNYTALSGYFIEAIKELSAKVEALESEVNTLKGS